MNIYYFIHLTGRDTGNTGIQRVVRNLGRSLLAIPGLQLVPVRWCHDQHAVVHAEKDFLDVVALHGGPKFSPNSEASRPVQPESRNHWLLVPEVPHLNSSDERYPPVLLQSVIGYARACNMRVAAVFHDLLPLTHPDVDSSSEVLKLKFMTYAMSLPYLDLVLPISEYTADIMRDYLVRNGMTLERAPRMVVVEEPAEMIGVERRVPSLDENAWTEDRIEFIAWGTVCRRKNQALALDAFNQLCARYPERKLHFHVVGHVHPEIAAEVRRHVARGRDRITMHGFVGDSALIELIDHARATVFLSMAEGFGLPLAESLWLGKPCLTSNIGSMKDLAADGGCMTVDPTSVSDTLTAMEALVSDKIGYIDILEALKRRRLRTWRDYAIDITGVLSSFPLMPAPWRHPTKWLRGILRERATLQRHTRELQPLTMPRKAEAGLTIFPRMLKVHPVFLAGPLPVFNGAHIHFARSAFPNTAESHIFFGPYISVGAGHYIVSIDGQLRGKIKLNFTRDVGTLISAHELQSFEDFEIEVPEEAKQFEIVGERVKATEDVLIRAITLRKM